MTAKTKLAAGFLLLTTLVAGCGVRPSGVITGDPAPTGPADGVSLYLVTNKKVTLVLRPTSRQLSPSETLDLLAEGPTATEQASGVSSEVPANTVPLTLTTDASGLTVTTSADVLGLSTVAVDQLVCTARTSLVTEGRPPGSVPVTLVGHGQSRGPQTCPLSG